jgi:cysteine desulfurase/selenocysteine lyase
MGKTYDTSSDFPYLAESDIYLDSACQSLRPQSVIDAMCQYYTEFNSCGERVKYRWGQEVDQRVDATRAKVLKLLKLSDKDYFVSFTLNTTYGINLLLDQLRPDGINQVVTSDIEHNSPFLSTMTFAAKQKLPRRVINRLDDGSIELETADFDKALVVLNSVSNIDGRQLKNLRQVNDKIHRQNGIFIIDAAQTLAYYHQLLQGVKADAICFSSHKMYGPSLGVMVVKKSLVERLDTTFIGGGMVDDVRRDDFDLSAKQSEHIYTIFEAGLQPYAEIIGLGAAIDFLVTAKQTNQLKPYGQQIFDFLKASRGVNLLNQQAEPTMAFYHDKIDAHLLAEALSDAGVMARSGYFCCHYYLDHLKHYPPLLRLSLGLHNRSGDIERLMAILGKVFR